MDLLKELLQFLEELKQYREILTNPDSKLLEAKRKNELSAAFPFLQDVLPKKSREVIIGELREHLVRKTGRLKMPIIELTGKENISRFNRVYNIWDAGLSAHRVSNICDIALDYCIDAVNEAIGKLEEEQKAEEEKSLRELFIKKPQKITQQPNKDAELPKAFIAHGGRSGVLDKLCEFIEALGLEPLIVELLPSKGMSVDDKVNNYIKDADCGIVLATRGGIVDTTSSRPKQHPRLNIIDEVERLRTKFPDRTILLLEKGVDFPSNISGLTHEPFTRQSMDRAFIAIARELREMGILKTEKPPSKESPL